MNSAIWGLIGVVIGGLITAISTYLAEWRKRHHEGSVAQVAALIEIEEALRAIQLSRERWAIGWTLIPWNQTWPAIQAALADSLTREGFRSVRTAYGSMFLLQQGLVTIGGTETTDEDREFFGWAESDLEAAREALGH